MWAARILRLARTRRCAIVGSGTRNARAISGVCRPATRRRVSATCALWSSAGWQQVKIRRSWSSCTRPTSSSSSGSACSAAYSCSRWAWACRSARLASRRSRSMARLRAVVMIQAPGLGGSPVVGQVAVAATKASCTASSAMSMLPKTRTSVATDRPDSARKIRPIWSATPSLPGGLSARPPALPRWPRRGTPRSRPRPGAPRPAPGRPRWPARRCRRPRPGRSARTIQKPPRYSLVSAYGPSVSTASPSLTATTVAVSRGCSPHANTHLPCSCSSTLKAPTSANICCISSGAGSGLPLGSVHGQHVERHGRDPFRVGDVGQNPVVQVQGLVV